MPLTTYLLLFRGVGGPVQLPVAELRAALTKAGFTNATTYINSGNALVRSTLTREETIAKFNACTDGQIPAALQRETASALSALEAVPDVAPMMDALTFARAEAAVA